MGQANHPFIDTILELKEFDIKMYRGTWYLKHGGKLLYSTPNDAGLEYFAYIKKYYPKRFKLFLNNKSSL